MLISKPVSWGLIWKSLADRVNKVFFEKKIFVFYLAGSSVTSCVHFFCEGTLWKCAACCTISPASNSPKPYLQQGRKKQSIMCICEYDEQEHGVAFLSSQTWNWRLFMWVAECGCRSRVSANGSDTRRQQVIDEDDVVLWHNRFPLCPCWGWGLLFVCL